MNKSESEIIKLKINWEIYDLMVKDIANKYKDEDLECIVGLSRGGLPLGVHLSNLLNVPFVPLEWQTRDGDAQDVLKLFKIENAKDISKTLFVDDICDSGKTIEQINKLVKGVRWAVLISKIPNLVEYSADEILGEEWIEFPWEY